VDQRRAHHPGPDKQEQFPAPVLKLRELDLSRKPRHLQQTYTNGPGYTLANTAGCDGCGAQVTRASLEEIRAVTLGGRPIEIWYCKGCGQAVRGAA
jgi:hypothetical protein